VTGHRRSRQQRRQQVRRFDHGRYPLGPDDRRCAQGGSVFRRQRSRPRNSRHRHALRDVRSRFPRADAPSIESLYPSVSRGENRKVTMHTNKNDRRPGHLTRNRHSFSFNHANFAGQTLSRWFGWLLGSKTVQNRLKSRIQAGAPGWSDEYH
jgi:hypothetical protein